MDSILNWVTYIPLLGALFILVALKDAKAIRVTATVVALIDLVASLYLWYGFDPKLSGEKIFQFRWTRHLRLRRRRHRPPAHRPDDVHGPHRHHLVVQRHRPPAEGVLHPSPPAADRHDRHVLRAGHVPLLRLLGNHARADVLHHRHLGRAAKALRGHQVLPLHPVRIGAHAAGDPGPLLLQQRRDSVPQHRRPR